MHEDTNTTVGKRIYNWNRIRQDIMDETPKEGSFEGVYSQKVIKADRDRVRYIKAQLGVEKEHGVSDSRIQEYATAQEIGEMDWFEEQKRDAELFLDGEGEPTTVFLSSEYDDFVNHIDAVCLAQNADTDFRTVPFALDMTYNTNSDKLDKKLGWQHPYLRTPGLATVKYFEDTFHGEPLIPKGGIQVLPRFVVGFSPDLSHEITELRMTTEGWDSLQRDEKTAKAKWCVLRELKAQSEGLLKRLQGRVNDDPRIMQAYWDAEVLDKYFGGAIEAAQEGDRSHQDWIDYPERDAVFNAIMAKL